MGHEGIAPPFLTLALDVGEWSALRTSHFIPWGNSNQCPLDSSMGGPQRQPGCCAEHNIIKMQGIEPGMSNKTKYDLEI
jgi:hypothetical protein